jgi:sugar fermentation stimulation protein A|tara:strand:+ start:680 stop:1402 length:723 start_codon:yes stop_codon:yes gene_type:complete
MNFTLKKIEMLLDWKLLEAEFIDRPNRFLTRVKFNGEIVESHLPDPGRLKELLIQGVTLLIKKETNPNRKTKFSTQAVYLGEQLISLNSWLPNQFVEFLLKNKAINFLEEWDFVRREIPFGKHRFDFLLVQNKKPLYVEVKSVTLVEDGIAKFPDSVTERGKRHVEHLAEMTKNGIDCLLLFVVQRSDAKKFQPQWERDPKFSKALLNAYNDGLNVKVIQADIQKSKIIFCGELPFSLEV